MTLGHKVTTVGIVDDHEVVRVGLMSAFAKRKDLRLVGEGRTADDAIAIAQGRKPDVLILDLSMPGGGMTALKEIAQTHPDVRCIILTASDDATVAMAALHHGARGYVLKGSGMDNLFAAIGIVMTNQSYISPEFATNVISATVQSKTRNRLADDQKLNFRENQVLSEVERGLTNRQIGEKLMLSERTVKHYVSTVMQKFSVKNRVAAVNAYRRYLGGERQSMAPDEAGNRLRNHH